MYLNRRSSGLESLSGRRSGRVWRAGRSRLRPGSRPHDGAHLVMGAHAMAWAWNPGAGGARLGFGLQCRWADWMGMSMLGPWPAWPPLWLRRVRAHRGHRRPFLAAISAGSPPERWRRSAPAALPPDPGALQAERELPAAPTGSLCPDPTKAPPRRWRRSWSDGI